MKYKSLSDNKVIMFRPNELTNLLYSDVISKLSSKIELVPRYVKEIVSKYDHKVKKSLESIEPYRVKVLSAIFGADMALAAVCAARQYLRGTSDLTNWAPLYIPVGIVAGLMLWHSFKPPENK